MDPRPHLPEMVVDLDHEDHYSDTSRIKGLSDGVFSIAMTLLAFSLLEHIPLEDASALDAASFWGTFARPLAVYGMSFIVLGTFWIGHAIQFHYVIRSDRPLMVRTVIFLLFVSLVPFSAAYLGRFTENPVAIAFYCANLMLCGLALQGTLLYATKDPVMLHRVMDRRIFRGIRAAYLGGPILYALAFLLSVANPFAGFLLLIAIPLLTFFPNPFWGKIYRRIVGNAASNAEDATAVPRR